jgi:phosphotransferase system  glucose/maltose/N-acetylglucosamine-specific IIC component
MLIGFSIAGSVVGHWQTSPTSHNWQSIWLVPGGIAVAVLILFMLFFTDKNRTEMQSGLDIEEPSPNTEI